MTLALEELAAVLGAQARELRRLLELGEEQERTLLRGDAAALNALTARQETLARRLARLEDQRQTLVGRIARDLGTDPAALSLSALLRLLPEAPPALATAREEMRGLLGRLVALNARNGFLAERALGYLDRLLGHLLATLAPGVPTYASNGLTARAAPALQLFDREA